MILGKRDIDIGMNNDQVPGLCEANNTEDDDINIEIKEHINIMIDINLNVIIDVDMIETTTNMEFSGKRIVWLLWNRYENDFR